MSLSHSNLNLINSKDHHTLVFDLSNVAYIGAYMCGKDIVYQPAAAEQIKNSTLNLMRKIYKSIQPDAVWFACDHSEYWRREIFPDYKAHRKLTDLKQLVRDAVRLIKKEKSNICIEVPRCEADDVIYTLSKYIKNLLTIVSSDSDFVQLESQSTWRFHPKNQAYITPSKNAAYDLFVKCIRGDSADNIPSAYPYVKSKYIESAFRNKNFYAQLMNTINKHGKKVEEVYQFNKNLIDLSCIPQDIQFILDEEIQNRLDQSYFANQKLNQLNKLNLSQTTQKSQSQSQSQGEKSHAVD